MKYSKILKKIKENSENLSMIISDYSYLAESEDIAWLDVVEEGVWSYTQEDVVKEINRVLEIIDKSKVSTYVWNNRFVLKVNSRPFEYEIFMNR